MAQPDFTADFSMFVFGEGGVQTYLNELWHILEVVLPEVL